MRFFLIDRITDWQVGQAAEGPTELSLCDQMLRGLPQAFGAG